MRPLGAKRKETLYKEQYKKLMEDIFELELKGLEPDNWPTMPVALKEYYEVAGNNKEINEAHNYLIQPDEIEQEGNYFVFYTENQGVVLWGVHKDDLEKSNPPVYILWYEDELRVTNIKQK